MSDEDESATVETWLESRELWGLGRYKPRLWLYRCLQRQLLTTVRYVGFDNVMIYRGQSIKEVIFMQVGMLPNHAFAENFATATGIPPEFLTGTQHRKGRV